MKNILFLLFLTGCASTPQPSELPERVIDAHTHTNFNRAKSNTEKEQMIEKYHAALKSIRAQGAIALTLDHDRGFFDLKKHHVFHCVGIRTKFNIQEIDQKIKTGQYRCIKVYLGYVHKPATDPLYTPLFELAKKHHVPMVFHTGDTLDQNGLLKYADPIVIDELAVKHRDINFVIAHLGNPWVQTAAEVVYKNPNVYADVSAFLIGDLDKMSDEKIERYIIEPIRWAFGFIEDPNKLMFGTDYPLVDSLSYLKAVARAIPKEHWDQVFYLNAKKVYGFE